MNRILLVIIGSIVLFFFQSIQKEPVVPQPATEPTFVELAVIKPVPDIKTDSEPVYDVYPTSVEERKQALTSELAKQGANGEMIFTLLYIAKRESINTFDPAIKPVSEVRHCKRPDGTFYAVEITSDRKQASCKTGDVQTYAEKSTGIWQILPTTFKGYKCTGDINNWKDQAKCAIILANSTKGFNHWVAYQKGLQGI